MSVLAMRIPGKVECKQLVGSDASRWSALGYNMTSKYLVSFCEQGKPFGESNNDRAKKDHRVSADQHAR
jgi:hypothetical protein